MRKAPVSPALLAALLVVLLSAASVASAGVPPTIVTDPAAQLEPLGGEATFTVAASGDAPLTYRWRKDGIDLVDGPKVSGATTDVLLLSDLTAVDAGNYSVVVTNGSGSAASVEAPLTTRPIRAGDIDPTFRRIVFPIDALALRPDGKVLVGGSFSTVNEVNRSNLVLVNRDGSIGAFPTAAPNGAVRALALQPDGKVLLGGNFTDVGLFNIRSNVARLNADGTVDPTFMNSIFFSGASDEVTAIALQPDGLVILGGAFTRVNGETRNGIARVNVDGSLDLFQFGMGGANGTVHALALQPDGKVLLGGEFTSVNGATRNGIARLEPDGSLDTSFLDGMAGVGGVVRALALQPDGKVLIGGTFTSVNGVVRERIARLNADGSLDAFQDGMAGANGTIRVVVLQPDGKVLLGGEFTSVNGAARNRVARLGPDGGLDPDFLAGADDPVHAIAHDPTGGVWIAGRFHRVNGVVRPSIAILDTGGDLVDGVRSLGLSVSGGDLGSIDFPLAIQPDGKLLLGGPFVGLPIVSRFHLDGTIDTSFSGPARGYYAAPLALQPDGKAVTHSDNNGFFSSASTRRLWRVLPDGSPDPSFHADFSRFNSMSIFALAVQPDGRVLVGGFFTHYGSFGPRTPRGSVARINADGTLDTTFMNGMSGTAFVEAFALQADGKVILGGNFPAVNGVTRGRVARLNPDGSVDTTFQEGMAGANGVVHTVVLQPDGKVLLGGQFTRVNGAVRHRIARLNPDGSLDTTFQEGMAGVSLGASDRVWAIAVQPDGKVLIGGSFTTVNGVLRSNLARLDADGSLDTGFESAVSHPVAAIALASNGRVWVGGIFPTVNGKRYPYVVRLHGGAPPTADAGVDQVLECEAQLTAPATLDGSASTDPDSSPGTNDDLVAFDWSEDAVQLASGEVAEAPFGLGPHTVSLRVTDSSGLTDEDTVSVTVLDRLSPQGAIVFPSEGACLGPDAVPVIVLDSFTDVCDPALTRSYEPDGGPAYGTHGDHSVRVTATDVSGNAASATVGFTIDTTPPTVTLATPAPSAPISLGSLDLAVTFTSADEDAASGGVVHEVVLVAECEAFDGFAYGDGDGLLSDESIHLGRTELCRIASTCGLTQLVSPEIRVEAEDCGGNVGAASVTLDGTLGLVPGMCDRIDGPSRVRPQPGDSTGTIRRGSPEIQR